MDNRGNSRWVSGFLVILILAAAGLAYSQWNAKRRLEVAVENQYFRSFFDLVSNVDNVRVSLSKSLAAGSPRLRVGALSDVWREASNAQANLNNLPVTQQLLMRTSSFLTQVGDFAFATARKVANQHVMSEEDWSRLAEMKKQSEELSKGLADMEARASAGKINWVRVAQQAKSQTKPKAAGGDTDGTTEGMQKAAKTDGDGVTDGITRVDEQFQHFPTLIYDGPFSDHMEQRRPAGVTGPMIKASDAEAVARRFVPFDASNHTATIEEEIKKSKIPVFRVRLEAPKKGGLPDALVDVTEQGGHVAMMSIDREAGKATLDYDKALDHARKFLVQSGYPQMEPTFVTEVGGVVMIPFVYVQSGVYVYPDLIKVKVALDKGDVISFDAQSYLVSHETRTIPAPKISADEAKELLSPALEVTDKPRMAVIPIETVDTPEAVCWEFKGTSFGDDFYVYINTQDGSEEKILQLIKTPEGTLSL